jgi:modulator of FtsH protease HflK
LGKPDRQEHPGLHFRLPYPVEEVYLPKVTRQNIIDIGMRSGEPARRVLEVLPESLILTGDENIVDIHFVVF